MFFGAIGGRHSGRCAPLGDAGVLRLRVLTVRLSKRSAQNDGLLRWFRENRQRQGRWSWLLERSGRLWRIKAFGILPLRQAQGQDDDVEQTTTRTGTNKREATAAMEWVMRPDLALKEEPRLWPGLFYDSVPSTTILYPVQRFCTQYNDPVSSTTDGGNSSATWMLFVCVGLDRLGA